MQLRSATAIALALGLAAFSSNAMAGSAESKSGSTTVLPGNVGGEGSAGAVARKKGMIGGTSGEAVNPMREEEAKLPGNVKGEGNAGTVTDPLTPAHGERKGAESRTPVEKRLPGNVGGEGSGKTK
jgi:hypothetical protein